MGCCRVAMVPCESSFGQFIDVESAFARIVRPRTVELYQVAARLVKLRLGDYAGMDYRARQRLKSLQNCKNYHFMH